MRRRSLLADELLQQADRLAAGTTQADLRGAIRAAYYAVFHALLRAAADMICSSPDPADR